MMLEAIIALLVIPSEPEASRGIETFEVEGPLGRDNLDSSTSRALRARSARNDTARAELARVFRAAATRMATGEFVTPLSSLFAPTGVYISSEPLSERGPTAARAWLQRDSLNVRSIARWTIVRHDVSADGRDGYSYGYLDVIRPNGDTLPGKYHAYWRRNASGAWQLLAFFRGRRAPGPITDRVPGWLHDSAGTRSVRPTTSDTVTLLREIMATERAFAEDVGLGTQAAFMKYAAPDGAKMDRGPAYSFGRTAIGELFAGPPPGPGPFWTPEVGSAAASGDLGFTTGPVSARRPGEGPAPPPGAKYFSIWRRLSSGEWRYVVD
jgi:ketosteroid isomerase-like protein